MASPLAHALVGAAAYAGLAPRGSAGHDWRPWGLAALAGAAADLDFLPGLLVRDPSRYHHWATHSLVAVLAFVLVVAPVAPPTMGPPRRRLLILGLAYASHLALDLVTVDRSPLSGIPLFWPVSSAVFIAPRPFLLDLHHGRSWDAFVNWHNVEAVLIEGLVVGLPVLALCLGRLAREAGDRARQTG